ncbi:hypothetical protein C900_02105 [Fulvivirga imtechensis AK7]|uniref:Uncharacterized protein n=1 Tax=Fulvivirga imtechensis AK7 TaxID=1237149 RepID=L8JXA5_9BACT|nr:alkaline phosphatase D family protein [Fulvivirga imtechensis]ELR73701.1 hypothetical protein C900_02105 [Fulvivirga imtechensis AK7]
MKVKIFILLGSIAILSCNNTPDRIPNEFLVYVWSGAVTDTSAAFAFKLTQEAAVRLVASTAEDFTKNLMYSDEVEVREENFFTAKASLDSLSPDTDYFYKLEIDGDLTSEPRLTGKFRTFASGPFSYKMIFASCAETGSSSQVFETIREQDPLFFLNTGDLHYANISSNCEYAYANAFFDVQESATQSQLYRSVPIAYIWDDHDFGPNNSAKDSNCRNEAIDAYKNFVPHYPLAFGDEQDPVSQVFNAGRVKYILTDLRSQKVRPEYNGCEQTKEGTNFGSDKHLSWFKEQLLEAKYDSMVVAWVSGIPWISDERSRFYECDENDDWGGYEKERREIANFIRYYEIPVFILAGDTHILAIDDGSNSDYADGGGAPIPIFHAAPLDNYNIHKGGPYSHGYSAETHQFGLMEVSDTGGDQVCIRWTGLNQYGRVLTNNSGAPMTYEFCKKIY